MDFLLTWICKHIANPFTLRTIQHVLAQNGLNAPYLMTPELLLETRHAAD
jgi:hypothetical protein